MWVRSPSLRSDWAHGAGARVAADARPWWWTLQGRRGDRARIDAGPVRRLVCGDAERTPHPSFFAMCSTLSGGLLRPGVRQAFRLPPNDLVDGALSTFEGSRPWLDPGY